jgi:tripartite-type tricarboxylate transporter receptor subunit TctC
VRLIVPFAIPGGTTDIVARIVSAREDMGAGRSARAWAGGGREQGRRRRLDRRNEMIKATPDGYVLGMATVSTTAANPAINPKIGYNPRSTSRRSSTSRPRPT